MRQTDPYELEKTRHTRLFPVPVQAYLLPVLPPGVVVLRDLGLERSDEDTTEATRAELDYRWPEAALVFVGHGVRWLLPMNADQPYHLIPYPIERVGYEAGDRIFDPDSRALRELRCGEVTDPDPRKLRAAEFQHERVTVQWDGLPHPCEVLGRRIQLDRGEPRCKLM